MLKICSWNVNGIRAVLGKGFWDWFNTEKPDILGLQEVKARPEQLEKEAADAVKPAGYESLWNPAEKAGYSGTALYYHNIQGDTRTVYDDPVLNGEGRITEICFDYQGKKTHLFNVYFPNGQKDDERLDYKMRFYSVFQKLCAQHLGAGHEVIVIGDVNTAHRPIDLKNPKENEKNSGFLPQERAWITEFLSAGFIDTWRHLYPEQVQYSWWTYRFNARAKNVGWRIDYVFISQGLLPYLKEAFIRTEVNGSDHCPVGIILE